MFMGLNIIKTETEKKKKKKSDEHRDEERMAVDRCLHCCDCCRCSLNKKANEKQVSETAVTSNGESFQVHHRLLDWWTNKRESSLWKQHVIGQLLLLFNHQWRSEERWLMMDNGKTSAFLIILILTRSTSSQSFLLDDVRSYPIILIEIFLFSSWSRLGMNVCSSHCQRKWCWCRCVSKQSWTIRFVSLSLIDQDLSVSNWVNYSSDRTK